MAEIAGWHYQVVAGLLFLIGVLGVLVRRNIIVMFMSMGLITAFLGMIIAFPLIGHATWHAYRDVLSGTMPSEEKQLSEDRPFYP